VTAWNPVPESGTESGLVGSLLTSTREADSTPVVLGVNVTGILQLAETARDPPHVVVLLKSAAFAPAIEIDVIVSEAVPVLVSTTVQVDD